MIWRLSGLSIRQNEVLARQQLKQSIFKPDHLASRFSQLRLVVQTEELRPAARNSLSSFLQDIKRWRDLVAIFVILISPKWCLMSLATANVAIG